MPFDLLRLFTNIPPHRDRNKDQMAMATAAVAPPNINGAIMSSTSKTQKRMNNMVYAGGLKSFGGLKACNGVTSLGLPSSTEECFAKVVSSVKATASNGKGKGGGAISSTCNAADEIFKIAGIMNGLVLIGVAVGFILLRIEAWFEESENE